MKYNGTSTLSIIPGVRASVACHGDLEPVERPKPVLVEHGIGQPEGITCDALMARAFGSLSSGEHVTGTETAKELAERKLDAQPLALQKAPSDLDTNDDSSSEEDEMDEAMELEILHAMERWR